MRKENLVTNSEVSLTEPMITPNSFLIDQRIKSLNFIELFNQTLIFSLRLGKISKKLTTTYLRSIEDGVSSIQDSDRLVLISPIRFP